MITLLISRGVNPYYIKNEMTLDEMDSIVFQLNNDYKANREFERLQTYLLISTQTDKIKSPSALYQFSWENNDDDVEVSDEEIEKRKQALLNHITK